jgi:hypothetical protein
MEEIQKERETAYKSEREKFAQLNSLSPSMCAAKWYDATIWLYSGRTASCHHPLTLRT